jgi:hypothetical protein
MAFACVGCVAVFLWRSESFAVLVARLFDQNFSSKTSDRQYHVAMAVSQWKLVEILLG